MICRGIFLVIFLEIYDGVWAFEESYSTLEEFPKAMNSSLISVLQDSPGFLGEVITDLISDLVAFLSSNFGYNRLILAKQVEKTLKELDDLTPPKYKKKISEKDEVCIERNKFILFFLLREATMDWSCLETQVLSSSRSLKSVLQKLMQLKDIPGSECNMGVFCLITKGLRGATVGTSLSVNLINLSLTAFDFFAAVRRCQKKIDPFVTAYDISVGNIKYCLSVKP